MIQKFVLTVTLMLLTIPMMGQNTETTPAEEFDWEPVMEAIIWHESKGNPRAVCGPYVGVMQIAPVMVPANDDGIP